MASGERPGAALLFRNALECPGKESGQRPVHQGAFLIASSLRAAGVPVVWSDLKVSSWGPEDLRRLIAQARGVNFIGLTLYDSYFERAKALLERLRAACDAYIAVGGLMPTRHPWETLAHLPEADFVVRGAGEELVPRLMSVLGGRGRHAGLEPAQLAQLHAMEGFLFAGRDGLIRAAPDKVLRPADPDAAPMDFGLLEKENVASGIQLCLSRGCRYGCLFCTSIDQGRFTGVSPRRFAEILAAYGRRLSQLYGRWSAVPPAALGLGFYDDDFLGDPDRACKLLAVVRKSPFFVRFIQASVSSFFRRGGSRLSLESSLMDALSPEVFEPKFGRLGSGRSPQVYLGTESFCDAELERLGKSHRRAHTEALAGELSRRRLRQAHHFIASNVHTEARDIEESLAAVVRLCEQCGPWFAVLEPVIPYLKSFPLTPSYGRLEREGLLAQVRLRGRLEAAGLGALDYPLVDHDEPLDQRVAAFARALEGKIPVDWPAELARWRSRSGAHASR